jgi:CheY-like chemotaxis protein
MTIGSAASRPGHGQEAQFPAFHSFHGNARRLAVPRIADASPPQQHLSRTALPDDPPRGRILVVTDQAPLALDVQRALRGAGYRVVGPAASTNEAERLTNRCPIDGAVVDLQLLGSAAAVVASRLAHCGIPFVWLTDVLLDAIPRAHAFAPAVMKPFKGEDLIEALERALSLGHRSTENFYPVPPPQEVWPRVFPQPECMKDPR